MFFLEESSLLLENTTNQNELKFILDKKSNSQIFFTSDLHIYKENIKDEHDNLTNLDRYIRIQNKYVKHDDVFIYVGDLSYNRLDSSYDVKVINFFNQLNGIKVLIKGNHDKKDDSYYKNMGFDYIFDEFIYKNYIITHQPIMLDNYPNVIGGINIHGHIHGLGVYDRSDKDNHIDVFFKRFPKGFVSLQEILNNFDKFQKSNINSSDSEAFTKKFKNEIMKYDFKVKQFILRHPEIKNMSLEEIYNNMPSIMKQLELFINEPAMFAWVGVNSLNKSNFKNFKFKVKNPKKKIYVYNIAS